MATTRLANQMTNVGRRRSPFVDRRALRQMDVAHDPDLFEECQSPVDDADVGLAERLGKLLGSECALLDANCVEDCSASLADGVAVV